MQEFGVLWVAVRVRQRVVQREGLVVDGHRARAFPVGIVGHAVGVCRGRARGRGRRTLAQWVAVVGLVVDAGVVEGAGEGRGGGEPRVVVRPEARVVGELAVDLVALVDVSPPAEVDLTAERAEGAEDEPDDEGDDQQEQDGNALEVPHLPHEVPPFFPLRCCWGKNGQRINLAI